MQAEDLAEQDQAGQGQDQTVPNDLTPQEKHEIWMKNSGYLYDRLLVHNLKWPSLTFQWLPHVRHSEGKVHLQFLIATHTSGKNPREYVRIMEAEFPLLRDMDSFSMNEPRNLMRQDPNEGGWQAKVPQQIGEASRVHKLEQFSHEIETNRVRYNQADPSLLASRLDCAPIAIFKRTSEPMEGYVENRQCPTSYPVSVLSDQLMDSGFGIEWSEFGLLAGDQQGKIALWKDIEYPAQSYQHSEQIEDTKFVNKDIFLSVGDEGSLCVWDTRVPKGIVQELNVSRKELYCCAVNPANNNIVLTAGQEGLIKLWDARNYGNKLCHFDACADEEGMGAKDQTKNSLVSLQWSEKSPTIFASGSQSGKVKIWDMLRIGFQIPKDNSGTEQLLFTHEGHQGEVLDLGWHPEMMLLGSTEEEFNTLQMFQISNCIQDLEFAEDMEYLRMQCLS